MRLKFHYRISSLLLSLAIFFSLGALSLNAQEDPVVEETAEVSAGGAVDLAAGEALFKGNCASCHKVHKKLVGPALAGVSAKYEPEWLYPWIKNSQKMIKSGDERALAIYNEYNQSVMTAFPTLSNGDIDNIIAYIESVPVPDDEIGGPGTVTEESGFAWTPGVIFLAVITLLLLAMVFILGGVLRSLSNVTREKRGLPTKDPVSFKGLWNNRPFKVVASLALFSLLAYTTYDTTADMNRMKGYEPDQPIKFSHKLHAGQWGIECQYCHSGTAKGKSAVIPSLNVCMNCHKHIQEGPEYGTKEIAKIYEYAGFDPETKTYDESKAKPIEWVRIHNLPDHVYFNHSQHVAVGKVECQTCHGPVEEMEVVAQENTLGMGWCITCHRETNVNFSGNDYYSIYEKYHNDLKEGKMSEVKVSDIGGLECQKCHY